MDQFGTGRVKLSEFYGKSENGGWQFLESVDYLRSLGAIDESSTLQGPQVIIPNYVSGMSNCITSAAYYSVCCVNECDKIYQHLEKDLGAPMASVSEILQSVDSMPIGSNINTKVRARLEEIASQHSGKVPLHGRLFAQWLHHAFPHECPMPHAVGASIAQMTPAEWKQTTGKAKAVASTEEM